MGTDNGANNKDVFDFLGINLREDSYSELLANLFKDSPMLATDFYRAASTKNAAAPYGLCRVKTRVALRAHHHSNIPDLCLYFKAPPTIWVIEAKVEAVEGKDQTQRYYDHRGELPKHLGAPSDSTFAFTLLTLDGDDGDKPLCPRFAPTSFESLLPSLASTQFVNPRLQLEGYIYPDWRRESG